MNCRKGDIAVIRTTHPFPELRGRLVSVVLFVGDKDDERDLWVCESLGGALRTGDGMPSTWGLMPDRYLFPLRDSPDNTVDISYKKRRPVNA